METYASGCQLTSIPCKPIECLNSRRFDLLQHNKHGLNNNTNSSVLLRISVTMTMKQLAQTARCTADMLGCHRRKLEGVLMTDAFQVEGFLLLCACSLSLFLGTVH